MIFENHHELKERIEALTPRRIGPHTEIPIFEDSSLYMAIDSGSVLRLQGKDYFVMGNTREGRFGLDEEPKFWVKYAIDLATGQRKIIKLVFYEQFSTPLGGLTVKCNRSPEKESEILELTRNHPRFMQGFTVIDPAGNAVRIIDFIRGKSLYNFLAELDVPHEEYFHHHLPSIMKELLPCLEALAFLHQQGYQHGDIRNDHILIERQSQRYTWIDFDYDSNFGDYDIWSIGNVLLYVVGKGIHTFQMVQQSPQDYPLLHSALTSHDALLFYKHRVAHLKKLFPYIPQKLNDILMRFSADTMDIYESMEQLIADLGQCFP